MKNMKKADAVISTILTALPLVALLLGMIPGSIRLYDPQTQLTNHYCLLSSTPSDMLATTVPLLLIVPLYVSVLGFFYLREQKLNTLKALMIFAAPAAVIPWMPVLLDSNLLFWPYGVIPVLLTVEWVASFIYYKIQDAKYEY